MLDGFDTGQVVRGRRSRRARRPSSRLRGCAILSLDSATVFLRNPRWPSELALHLLDDAPGGERPTLAWLVTPEALWAGAAGDPRPGGGLSPVQVAREVADAVGDLRVYADDHMAVGRWMRDLFAVAGAGELPFRVGDLISFFWSLKATKDEAHEAIGEAAACVMALRATSEAARHATFARKLAALADARRGRA